MSDDGPKPTEPGADDGDENSFEPNEEGSPESTDAFPSEGGATAGSDSSTERMDAEALRTQVVDEGVESLQNPAILRGVLGTASAFVAAALGLSFIAIVSLFRLVGLDYGDVLAAMESIFLLQEVLLVLVGVLVAGFLNYVLLAGLLGIDAGTKFTDDREAITVATVGCAVGVVGLVIVLVVSMTVGAAAFGTVAPSGEEIGAMTGVGDGPGGQFGGGGGFEDDPSTVESTDDGEGVGVVEVLGALFGVGALVVVSAVTAGITGGSVAYLTRRYGQ